MGTSNDTECSALSSEVTNPKNIDEIHRIVLNYRKVKGLDALKISTAHVRGMLYENLHVRVLFEAVSVQS